jgi:hypothetical protein
MRQREFGHREHLQNIGSERGVHRVCNQMRSHGVGTQVNFGQVLAKHLATIVYEDVQAPKSADMVIDDLLQPRNLLNRARRDRISALPFPFSSFLLRLPLPQGGKRWSHHSPLEQK